MKLKFAAICIVLASIIGSAILRNHIPAAFAAAPLPAVFFVPHQDDEILSMGASIIAHLKAGRDVKVVMVTDGNTTAARAVLCTQRGICLTPEQIGEARDLEFRDAMARIGVPAQNLYFEDKPAVDIATANEVISKYVALFGVGASYITMSWLDTLPDHYNLGYALNARCVASGKGGSVRPQLSDCRFYQSALYQPATPATKLTSYDRVVTPAGGYYTMTGADATRLRNAAAAYSVYSPEAGRYGIGVLSVATQFAYLSTAPRSWYHVPSNGWRTVQAKADSLNFVFRYQFR